MTVRTGWPNHWATLLLVLTFTPLVPWHAVGVTWDTGRVLTSVAWAMSGVALWLMVAEVARKVRHAAWQRAAAVLVSGAALRVMAEALTSSGSQVALASVADALHYTGIALVILLVLDARHVPATARLRPWLVGLVLVGALTQGAQHMLAERMKAAGILIAFTAHALVPVVALVAHALTGAPRRALAWAGGLAAASGALLITGSTLWFHAVYAPSTPIDALRIPVLAGGAGHALLFAAHVLAALALTLGPRGVARGVPSAPVEVRA